MSLDNWLTSALAERRNKNLFRSLKTSEGLIDFCSNDYLGLAQSNELFKRIHSKAESKNPITNGATGSRLLTGNSKYAEEVETKLSVIFKSEASLILNSGYSANLAVLSSLPLKGDTIIYDELAHASIKDGARLSLANRYNFKHNDLHDLENKIKKGTGKIFIAIESVYSMDGDECPLSELVTLAEKYGAYIILDEAHSTGVRGSDGGGLAVELGLQNSVAIRIYTFGKAMGIHGACVCGSKTLIDYLINFARPFIYTTALPAYSIASIECVFEFLKENASLLETLKQKIKLYKNLLPLKSSIISNSAIQVVVVSGNEEVRLAASSLQKNGFDVRPILSPTVPQGSERLRICLHTYNSDDDIINLSKAILDLKESVLIRE